jgi:hypothetical protein
MARLTFHQGRLEDFKRVAEKVLENVRNKDSGTLQYDIFFSDDQSECIFLERYRDIDAMLEHNDHLGELLGEMLGTGSVSAELFVQPTDDIRAKFAGLPIRFFTPFLAL